MISTYLVYLAGLFAELVSPVKEILRGPASCFDINGKGFGFLTVVGSMFVQIRKGFWNLKLKEQRKRKKREEEHEKEKEDMDMREESESEEDKSEEEKEEEQEEEEEEEEEGPPSSSTHAHFCFYILYLNENTGPNWLLVET